MRLPRTPLLSRLSGSDAPGVTLLEAPSGYGKSWLARRAGRPRRAADARRASGRCRSTPGHRPVVVDDAHVLGPDDVARLAEHMEDAPATTRLIIAGRILPEGIHDAAQLVDGTIVDADALAVSADEVRRRAADRSGHARPPPRRGGRRQRAGHRHRHRPEPARSGRPTRSPSPRGWCGPPARRRCSSSPPRRARSSACWPGRPASTATCSTASPAPGSSTGRRVAGIPLRRQVTGGLDLAAAASFRTAPVDSRGRRPAGRPSCSTADGSIEAISLLLDAGQHEQATRLVMELSESIIDTVEPRLLLVAAGPARPERRARAGPAAAAGVGDVGHRARRRRHRRHRPGRRARRGRRRRPCAGGSPSRRRGPAWPRAVTTRRCAAAEQALIDLGDGEEQTFARAHEVLAESAATSDARADLQRAAESYHIAVSAWEGCGEFARARACRRDLAASVFVPLGRYDEALTQLGQLLGTAELSDAERSITVLIEGFVLYNANRLESAESRFVRVTDLGYVHDNPRLIAMAAWGRALVASRARRRRRHAALDQRRPRTRRSPSADDVLGVPFLCDMATVLGALGELDLASRYLERAADRRSVFPDQVASTAFVLDARRGVLGDVAAGLAVHAARRVVAGPAGRGLRRRPGSGDLERARAAARRVEPRAGRPRVQQRGRARRGPHPPRAAHAPAAGAGAGRAGSARPASHRRARLRRIIVIGDPISRAHRRRRHADPHRATRSGSSASSSPTAARRRSTSSASRSGRARRSRPAGRGCATC